MPGSAAEQRAGRITQLGFDSLTVEPANERSAVPAAIATFGRPEVYRSAPHSRRKAKKHPTVSHGLQQSTFDDLFAATSREVDSPSPLSITSIRARNKKQNSQYAQLGFDSL